MSRLFKTDAGSVRDRFFFHGWLRKQRGAAQEATDKRAASHAGEKREWGMCGHGHGGYHTSLENGWRCVNRDACGTKFVDCHLRNDWLES